MSYPINRRPPPPVQSTLNRQTQNFSSRNLAQNALAANHHTQTQNSQTKSLQTNTTGTKPSSVVKTSISQLLRHDLLTPGQKNTLHKLTAFVNVIATDKFSGMLKNTSNEDSFEHAPASDFFNFSNSEDNFFTHNDVVILVAESGLCEPGRENEFVDSLVEICAPEQTNFLAEMNAYEFTAAAKNQLRELGIEEKPSELYELAKLLEEFQHSSLPLSPELKKIIRARLKENEDKNEIEEFDFNYMEISKVSN